MRREYFRIPPEMRKDSNMQHILVHDNLVVFWIFIQFQLRQSNYVQYRSAYLQVVNLNASAKIYRSLWFSYFCRHLRTFCECHYIHIWEICIPRSVQAKQILIGRFVECQSIKKVGGRRSVEELYQALFFVSPVPPECFTERNENRAWSQVTPGSTSRAHRYSRKQSPNQRKESHAPSRVDGVDAECFFILVFRVVNKDEYFSFSWELLWGEAESDTVRFTSTNLQIQNNNTEGDELPNTRLYEAVPF